MQIIDIEVSLSVPVKVGEETIELGKLCQKKDKTEKEEKVCKDSFESLQQIFDNRFWYFKFIPAEFKDQYDFHEFCIDTLLVPLWFKYKKVPEVTDFVIFDGNKTITLILRCLSYNIFGFRNSYKRSLKTISAQDIAHFDDAKQLYGSSVGKLIYSYLNLFKKMISNNSGFRRMKEVKKGIEFINTHEINITEIGYGKNSVTENVILSLSDGTDALLTKQMRYLDMPANFPMLFNINNIVYHADRNDDCDYEFLYPYCLEQLGFRSVMDITIVPSRYAGASKKELESLKPKRKIIFEDGVKKEIRRILNKKPNNIFHGSPGIYIIKDLPDRSDTQRNIEYLIEVLYRRNWIASDQLFRIGHNSVIISNKKTFTKRKSFFINHYCSPASNLIIEISDIRTDYNDEIEKNGEDNRNKNNTVYTEEDLREIFSAISRHPTVTVFFITESYKVSTKLEELIYSSNFYPINLMGRINLDDVEEYNTKKQEDTKEHVIATLERRGYDKSKIKLPNLVLEGLTLTEQDIPYTNDYYKKANIISNMSIMTSYNNKIVKEMTGFKKKEPKSPEKELKSMIGLSDIKATVKDIVNNIVLKKTLMDRNIPLENACMHMMFYGNPGTAKTTIARLVARILKKKGVLKTAKFKEAGRQDLVDQYVGWTAKKVEELIQRMRGGVLFIDEAYSLVEDRKSFASEAIDTLIQQMELIKKDTIIILAGYPDKMEELLDMNPGFRSRIAFHVKFPNYTKEELIKILKLMADKQKLILSEEYLEEVSNQLPKYMGSKDFGNGRFMRNLLEQSIMKLSTRLAAKYDDFSIVDTKTLTTLTKDDVAFDQIQKKNKNVIGFTN